MGADPRSLIGVVRQVIRTRLKTRYTFEPRGSVDVKGKGEMPVYLLTGRLTCPPP